MCSNSVPCTASVTTPVYRTPVRIARTTALVRGVASRHGIALVEHRPIEDEDVHFLAPEVRVIALNYPGFCSYLVARAEVGWLAGGEALVKAVAASCNGPGRLDGEVAMLSTRFIHRTPGIAGTAEAGAVVALSAGMAP